MTTKTHIIAKTETTPDISSLILTAMRNAGTECRFISMITETPVKVKKSCPHPVVIKLSKRNGMINVNFVKGVERRMAEKMGVKPSQVEYTPGSTWYEHEMLLNGKGSCVCQHSKDPSKKYLQYYPIRSLWTKYVDVNGKEIPASEVTPHLYARKESEFKPIVNVFSIGNIRSIRHRKVTISNA